MFDTGSDRIGRLMRSGIPLNAHPDSSFNRSNLVVRLSAVLLMVAALGVFFAHDAPTAQAGTAANLRDDERTFALGTMTVGNSGSTWRGYSRIGSNNVGQLTRAGFTYYGTSYEIKWLAEHNTSNYLIVELNKAIPADVKSGLVLYIADRRFALADGVINPTNSKQIRWANSREQWATGEQIHVNISFTDYWSATLTVRDLSTSGLGCDSQFSTPSLRCETSATLSDDTITLGSTTHTIDYIQIQSAGLFFGFADADGTYGSFTELRRYTLHVGNVQLPLSDATQNSQSEANAYWSSHGITWTAGQQVKLRLTKPKFTGVTFRDAANTQDIDEIKVAEDSSGGFNVRLARDPGQATVNVRLSKVATGCTGCPNSHIGDPTKINLVSDSDQDSVPWTVTLTFDSANSWAVNQRVAIEPVGDADLRHEHVLIVARVSTTSGNHPWYDSPDGFSSLFVTVTEVGDDGAGGGVGGQGSSATEGGSGGAPQPSESQTEPQGRPPPPQNIKIVPGDRQLTVTWEVGPRDGVENSEIRHALRWRQNPGPGKWKNTHPPHVLPKDGHSFKGGITSFVIKGLKNDVAADVQIRAFTGGNDYDHAVTTSNWIAFKGTETTPFKPNNPPTVASAIADVGPLTVGNDATIDLTSVFDDADGDLLTLDSTSSNDAVAIGFVQYSPDAELWLLAVSRGTADITVTANDERGGAVSDTFTVTIKEAPTVAKPIADISSLKTGKSKKISLSGVFADADGDALTLSAASSDTDVVSVTSQVDPGTSSATAITVLAVTSGTATITVTAQDTDGNRVIDTFDVTVPAAQQQVQSEGGAAAETATANGRTARPCCFAASDGLEGEERKGELDRPGDWRRAQWLHCPSQARSR